MKHILLIFMIFFLCGCANPSPVPPTPTSAGPDTPTPTFATVTPTPTDLPTIVLPPQGVYDSCVPDEADCLNHLDALAEKGFKLIVNYGQLYGDIESQLAYANHAESLGMQVIWSILPHFDRPDNWMITKYAALGEESGCEDNDCLIAYFVNAVKDHPATWGYYIADEVKPAQYLQLQEWSNTIRQADPDHPRLLVVAGSNDPMEQYYWFYSYMSDAADVIGPDYYPYGYIDDGKSLTRYTGDTARHAQYWADKLGKQSVMVLQAFAWSRYADTPLCLLWPLCASFPTYEQMKAQRDQTLLNAHPAIILWWTYEDILKTDDPAKHLADLAAAAFSPLPVATPEPVPTGDCEPGWICEDIGNPSQAGTQTKNGDTWTLQGAGWDIGSTPYVEADQFYYVWQNMAGDGYLSARIQDQGTAVASKAGIMVRKTFDPVSPYYAVLITRNNRIRVQVRTDFGGETQELTAFSPDRPVYLKINRSGTTYSAYTSEDGETWFLVPDSTVTIDSLADTLMAGLAVTSGDEGVLRTAIFEQVTHFPAP